MRNIKLGTPLSSSVSQKAFPLTELLRASAAERDNPIPQMNSALRRLDSRRGKIWLQRVGIAMNKIKDAMPARIHARDQVGPRHRALGRNAGGEQTKRPLLGQDRKVRHLAFGHELLQKLRVHAVDAENDDLPVAVPFSRLAGKQRHSDGTQQQEETKFLDSLGTQGRP